MIFLFHALRRRLVPCALALPLFLLTLLTTPLRAATLVWDSDGIAGGATGGTGTWDTTAALWNNAGAMIAWDNLGGHVASFGGTAGTVTLGTTVTAAGLTFNSSGYVITSTVENPQTLRVGGPITVTTVGHTALIQTNMALTAATSIGGAGTTTIDTGYTIDGGGFTLSKGGSGTLNFGAALTNGSTLTVSAGVMNLSGSYSQGTYATGKGLTVSGGTLNVTGTLGSETVYVGQTAFQGNSVTNFSGTAYLSNASSTFRVGEGTNATVNITAGTVTIGANSGGVVLGRSTATAQGFLNISGGALILTGNASVFRIGAGYSNGELGGASVLTISGTGLLDTGVITGEILLGSNTTGNTAGTGTINLDGGTLATRRTIRGGTVAASTFNFNGGTLKANEASMTLDVSLNTVNVRNGGGIIDTNGFNVSIAKALTHSAIVGDNAIDGGISKIGTGVLTFTGTVANTYTGVTRVLAGELALSKTAGVNAIADDVQVGDGTAAAMLRLINADQIADSSVITLQGTGGTAGVFRLNGRSETIGGLVSVNGEGIVENESATNAVLTLNNTGTQSYSGLLRNGTLAGLLSLVKAGSGTQILASATSYTGSTTIQAGTLQFGVNNALNATTSVVLAAAGGTATLSLDGHSWSSGAITFYNATSTSTSEAIIDLGTDGLLTMGNTLTLNNTNSPLGALITGGTLDMGAATRTFAIADSSNAIADLTIESRITSSAGAFGITKTGTGTLKLAGAVTVASTITVAGGVLEIAGTTNNGAATTSVGAVSTPGVLRLVDGGDYTTTTLAIGVAAAYRGSLVMSGGTLTLTTTNTQAGILVGAAGYGGLFLSGGTINTKRVDSGDGTTADSITVVQVTGGRLNTSNYIMFRNERWEFTVTGGEIIRTGDHIALGFRSGATVATATATAQGVMTMAGGLVDNGTQFVAFGQQNDASALGTFSLNLNAGILINRQILHYNGTSSTNGTSAGVHAIINFNGGTHRSSASGVLISTQGTTGTGSLTTYVNGAFGTFAGGAVIDTNSFTTTITNALLAPTGSGVSTIAITSGGSGYSGAPYVEISGGGGSGATAYAVVDMDPTSATYGQVTSIVVTNPGKDYTSSPTITLKGGGGTGAATGAVTTVVNTSGGVNKLGLGVLILAGTEANTFTGMSSVQAGELHLSKTDGVNAVAGNITVGTGTDPAILKLINSNQIADISILTFNGTGANAGIFRLNNRGETIGGLSSTGGAGIVENESGVAGISALNVNVASGTQTYSGILRNGDGSGTDGTLMLVKTGAGTQVLSGNNTYTGETVIYEGTLQLGDGGTSGTAGTGEIGLGFGGTLSTNRSDRFTLANSIAGGGAVAVNNTSTGITILNNAGNSYSGGTTVNTGTLMVNNTSGSGTGTGNVYVESAGTLAGTGLISPTAGNSVVVRGKLSVGDAANVAADLQVVTSGAGSFTVESGGALVFGIVSGAGSGGLNGTSSADLLVLGGSVVLNTGSILRVENPNNLLAWALGDAWQIIDWTTLGGTTRTGTFTTLELPDLGPGYDWDTSKLYTTGVISVMDAVPEPGRATLFLGAMVLMGLRRRRTRALVQ